MRHDRLRPSAIVMVVAALLAGCTQPHSGQPATAAVPPSPQPAVQATAPQPEAAPVPTAVAMVTPVPMPAHLTGDSSLAMAGAERRMASAALGQLALQRAVSPGVRGYARDVAREYTLDTHRFTPALVRFGVKPPALLNAETQLVVDRLSGLSGAEFDHAFLQEMAKGHERLLHLYEEVLVKAQDSELKAVAQRALPLVRQHLDLARSITP